MHGSKVGAQTWIIALFLIVANPKGRSSVQLAADLGVTQKTAWHLAHRIRAALDDGGLVGFDGPVEFDETYIGGKAKNMHAAKRRATIYGRGAWAKEMVVGARDRASGAVAARHLKDGQHRSLCRPIVDVATPGARVFTDGSTRYNNLERLGFRHESVAHTSGEYVRDDVSTNGVENYWSHLKRTWIGTYHFWSVGHLHRYVDEHSWRFNRRHVHVLKPHERSHRRDGWQEPHLPRAHRLTRLALHRTHRRLIEFVAHLINGDELSAHRPADLRGHFELGQQLRARLRTVLVLMSALPYSGF